MKKSDISLILSDPDHRHFLAKRFFHKNVKEILDIGGSSKFKKGRVWINFIGSPQRIWGAISRLALKNIDGIRYTSINVEGEDYRNDRRPDIRYNGKTIPFPDKSFDLVTAIDTFEHIKPMQREKVFREMLRVAKNQVIIVYPYYCKENNEFEEEFCKYMTNNGLKLKPSIKQHRIYGLPKNEMFISILDEKRYQYEIHYGTNREIFKHYLFFQVVINSLLVKKILSSTRIKILLKQLEEITTKVLNSNFQVDKKNAYRVIINITIPSTNNK